MFGLFRRRRRPRASAPTPRDPIAAFDALIEQLDRQGSEVRRSAAALLASRGELQRRQERAARQREELERRLQTAAARGDAKSEAVLRRDLASLEKSDQATGTALDKVAADTEVLLELSRDLTEQSASLRDERLGARARVGRLRGGGKLMN